ncbi:MAG: multiheme c-type cytochrome [Hyphomicrobiales bacterium]
MAMFQGRMLVGALKVIMLSAVVSIWAAQAALAQTGTADRDPTKITGPDECAECHKHENTVWKATHHFKTFRAMPRSKESKKITKKMKIKRVKSESLCLTCHFTNQKKKKRTKAISGISCESCHSAGEDWLKVHAEFSGNKKKELESKAQARSRWKKSEAAGMIRPRQLYKLAKNCYSCHVVPQEKLVNVGGHPAGSKFELVSWSQGEVRHNLWYSDGKKNSKASSSRKRMMYIVGVAVELETALRAVGKATKKKTYAVKMAKRAAAARKRMAAVAKALPKVKQLRNIVKAGKSAKLKLKNDAALSAAADKVAKEILSLTAKYNGSKFAAIDKMIPGPDKYKGKPAK